MGMVGTTTALSSSKNPSSFGQSVTFTAKVTGFSPTGTVIFFDGGTQIGTGTLAAGTATFTTSSLAVGSHSITAKYGGDPNNVASTSAALTQTVSVPTDSIKLRQLQVSVTPMIAQISGQAIVGAIDSAIDAGFSGNPQALTPNGGGFTFQIPLGQPAADIGGGGKRTASAAALARVIRRQGGSVGADAGSLANGRQGGNGAPPGTRLIDLPVIPLPPGSGMPPIGETRFSPDEVMFQVASSSDAAADRPHGPAFRPYHFGAANHRHAGPHCLHLPHHQWAIRARGDPPGRGRWAQCRGAAQLHLSPDPGSKQSQSRSGRSGTIHREKISSRRSAPDQQG